MEIGNKLQSLRKNAGYSQEELAEKIDVSRQTISKWELGETSPDLKDAKKLSKIFNVSLDELSGNDIKDVLITKVSNTEVLAGMIVKILRTLGVIMVSGLAGLLIMFILFRFLDRDKSVMVSSSTVAYCLVDGKREVYEAYETKDSPGVIEYSTSDIRMLKDMEINIRNYKDKDKLIDDVIKYVESTGGKCN